MPVNILGWIQNSTFRLRSARKLKFVIQTIPVLSGHSLLGDEVSTESGSEGNNPDSLDFANRPGPGRYRSRY